MISVVLQETDFLGLYSIEEIDGTKCRGWSCILGLVFRCDKFKHSLTFELGSSYRHLQR